MTTFTQDEQEKILSLEQGRELLKDTELAHISDEELQEVLQNIKTFCEIAFEMYLDQKRKKTDSSEEETSETGLQNAA